MNTYKILIVDDHSILQHGLCSSLEMESEFEIVGMAQSGFDAIKLCDETFPDLVIMDVSMPGLNGMEATKQILIKHPDIKVMALSMHIEKIYVNGMISAGAKGYILKSCSYKELVSGIHTVLLGETFFCDEAKILVDENIHSELGDELVSVFSLLSKRERQVLQLIAEGHKSRTIAQNLKISVKTVDIHRTNLKTKLNIHSIAELTKFAIAEGLTSAML